MDLVNLLVYGNNEANLYFITKMYCTHKIIRKKFSLLNTHCFKICPVIKQSTSNCFNYIVNSIFYKICTDFTVCCLSHSSKLKYKSVNILATKAIEFSKKTKEKNSSFIEDGNDTKLCFCVHNQSCIHNVVYTHRNNNLK